jgi:hypothetical protein
VTPASSTAVVSLRILALEGHRAAREPGYPGACRRWPVSPVRSRCPLVKEPAPCARSRSLDRRKSVPLPWKPASVSVSHSIAVERLTDPSVSHSIAIERLTDPFASHSRAIERLTDLSVSHTNRHRLADEPLLLASDGGAEGNGPVRRSFHRHRLADELLRPAIDRPRPSPDRVGFALHGARGTHGRVRPAVDRGRYLHAPVGSAKRRREVAVARRWPTPTSIGRRWMSSSHPRGWRTGPRFPASRSCTATT